MAPNRFDQASRYHAKLNPPGLLRWYIRRLPPHLEFRAWLDTRTIPFPGQPERTCDTVAYLVDPARPDEPWAVILEFQTAPDEEMFGRVQEFIGRFWREERPAGSGTRYAVVALVVNLTGEGNTARDFRLGQTGLRTCLRVGERNLAEVSAPRTLREIEKGDTDRCVLALIPLMRGGAEPGTIIMWTELAAAEPNSKLRSDYAALALVFAELTNCRPVWAEALKEWNMRESQQVLEWQAEARKEGELKGKAEGKAELVLRLLQRRAGTAIPTDLANKVRGMTNPAILDGWFDIADEVSSIKEFRKRIQANGVV